MKKTFEKSKGNINELFNTALDTIYNKENIERSFYNGYSTFNYKDELDKKTLNKTPMSEEEFFCYMNDYFKNAVSWDNTDVMYNIHPNVNNYGLIMSFFANIFNPNFAQDLSSGKMMLIEKEVIKYVLELVGWDCKDSDGLFTFGGKSTNLYALKVALDKTFSDFREKGVEDRKIKIISNDKGHPAHQEICNWMGIGINNCIRIKTQNNVTNPEDLEREIEHQIEKGNYVPLVILNGCSTLEHAVDDIKASSEVIDRVCEKYKLEYRPHIHVDSVIGWVYLFFNNYDFDSNPLNIDADILQLIKEKHSLIKNIKYADSFGVDFHKTGFCSYTSSAFITKNATDLYNIERAKPKNIEDMNYSDYSPYGYSLELSRSVHGPISALSSIKTLGTDGFCKLVSDITTGSNYIKKKLNKLDYIQVCNYEENSLPIFFIIKPDSNIEFDYNMKSEEVDKIKEYNLNFYKFLIHNLEKGDTDLFFSCSRSYKYLDQSFGSIKLYSFNSNLNKETADIFYTKLIELIDLYRNGNQNNHGVFDNFFDFLDIKGGK